MITDVSNCVTLVSLCHCSWMVPCNEENQVSTWTGSHFEMLETPEHEIFQLNGFVFDDLVI